LHNIARFAEPLNPSLILELAPKDPKFAWSLATDLIESHLDQDQQLSPSDLILLAHVGFHVLRALKREPSSERDDPISLTDRDEPSVFLNQLFSEAIGPVLSSWAPHEQFGALASWTTFLRLQNENELDANEKAVRALEMLAQNIDGRLAWAEFFEIEGDRCQSDKQAARIYEFGIRHKPEWAQNWIKGIGAEVLAEGNGTRVAEEIKKLPQKQFVQVFNLGCRSLTASDILGGSVWVKERWNKGLLFFLQSGRVDKSMFDAANRSQYYLTLLRIDLRSISLR
jgi:hypothetical protein